LFSDFGSLLLLSSLESLSLFSSISVAESCGAFRL
jgi:hypothetical protein